MIRIYPEQLEVQLEESLCHCYLLFGNDLLLLQESQDRICAQAQVKQFSEHFSVSINPSTDWDYIFSLCQAMSLFTTRQILLLTLPERITNLSYDKKLTDLNSLLHDDILLILRGTRLTRAQENSGWFKAISNNAVLVNCITPEQDQLPLWVASRAKTMNLNLNYKACHLLCYYYEGNLLALVQILEQLSLIYPDGNLTLPRVKLLVNDAARFTTPHWLDAVLAGNSNRANHILVKLQLVATEPVILLRSVQHYVLLLLSLKHQTSITKVNALFNQYKVWQYRRPLLIQALQRLTLSQLHQIVALMTKIELTLKNDYGHPVWPDLTALTLLLCGKALPRVMIYD